MPIRPRCRARFSVPCPPHPPFPSGRPPLSVSSGCHNSPASAVALEADPLPISGLEEAFRTERDRLLKYLGRRAGHDQAQDLVQEVFTRAAGSDQASQLANPAGFLSRIARNLLIDRARWRKKNNVVFLPVDDHHGLAVAPQQEWGLEAEDLLKLYEAAVSELPEKTRRVYLMHRVDELSYREIHERLRISIATVEYHMMKALGHIARSVDAAR